MKGMKKMSKRQVLNYITIIFSVSTISMAIYSVHTKKDVILCTIMLIITIILNWISNIYVKKEINLTKKDKEALDNLVNEKNKNKIKK
jgi:amino acid permease